MLGFLRPTLAGSLREETMSGMFLGGHCVAQQLPGMKIIEQEPVLIPPYRF
jgi:hypothetical protein